MQEESNFQTIHTSNNVHRQDQKSQFQTQQGNFCESKFVSNMFSHFFKQIVKNTKVFQNNKRQQELVKLMEIQQIKSIQHCWTVQLTAFYRQWNNKISSIISKKICESEDNLIEKEQDKIDQHLKKQKNESIQQSIIAQKVQDSKAIIKVDKSDEKQVQKNYQNEENNQQNNHEQSEVKHENEFKNIMDEQNSQQIHDQLNQAIVYDENQNEEDEQIKNIFQNKNNNSLSAFIIDQSQSYQSSCYKSQFVIQSNEKIINSENKSGNNIVQAFQKKQEKTSIMKQWYSHLQTLTFPQTQLLYLCQWMKWKITTSYSFVDYHLKLFSCQIVVRVNIGQNSTILYEAQCPCEKNKKSANHYASIVCFMKLYATMEGLWQDFRNYMEEKKTLQMPHSSDNKQILQKQYLPRIKQLDQMKKENIEQQKKQLTNKSQKEQIIDYLNNVKNYKSQMSYFLAQNPKIFDHPVWNMYKGKNYKKPTNYQVKIPYLKNQQTRQYRYGISHKNKKQAEEKIAKQILIKIYNDFPLQFKKFKEIKKDKFFA